MFSDEEISLIKNTVAKGTTDTELAFFVFAASKYGLDPIKKEIWCYKDSRNNLIVFAGRDGFLVKAQESKLYGRIRSSEICEKDEICIDIPAGKIDHKIKSFGEARGKILGAYAIVYRKGGEPTIEVVDFKTYDRSYNAWKTHPADMIKKVAETHALKKAFGISGLQCEDDFEIVNDKAYAVTNPDNIEHWKVTECLSMLDACPLSSIEKEGIRNELCDKITQERLNEIYFNLKTSLPDPVEVGQNYNMRDIHNRLDKVMGDERK